MKTPKPQDTMANAFMKFAEEQWGVKFVDASVVKPGGEKGIIRTIKTPEKKTKTLGVLK